jgi:hypothetical protein
METTTGDKDGNVGELRRLAESLTGLFKERDEHGPMASINSFIVQRAVEIANFVDRMEWRG